MLISLVTGEDLETLVHNLNRLLEAGNLNSLRVNQEGDGKVKFKINGGMWSHGVGGIDPGSDLAIRRAEVEAGRIRTLTDPVYSDGDMPGHPSAG